MEYHAAMRHIHLMSTLLCCEEREMVKRAVPSDTDFYLKTTDDTTCCLWINTGTHTQKRSQMDLCNIDLQKDTHQIHNLVCL